MVLTAPRGRLQPARPFRAAGSLALRSLLALAGASRAPGLGFRVQDSRFGIWVGKPVKARIWP